MTIQRDKVVLRETEVTLPDTTVGLFAQKKEDKLSFTDGKTTLSFDDVFPLSTGNPGVFGIVLPAGVRLDGLAARKQRLPASPSPLEEGRRTLQPEELRKGDGGIRQGRKHDRIGRAEVGSRLQEDPLPGRAQTRSGSEADLRETCGRSRAAANACRLPGLEDPVAICKGFRHRTSGQDLRQPERNVDYTDLALVLSEEERDEILSFYRQVGFFGRINFNPNRVRNLERASRSRSSSRPTVSPGNGPSGDSQTPSGWTNAIRTPSVRSRSSSRARDLLPDDRIGITRDYAWLMITGGTPGKALEEINRRLGPAPPGPEDVNFPMLVERARVHAARGTGTRPMPTSYGSSNWSESRPSPTATSPRRACSVASCSNAAVSRTRP